MKRLLIWIVGVLAVAYGLLWIFSLRTYRVGFGVSFRPAHAAWLGLDWRVVYKEILSELKPRFIRLAAEWAELSPALGQYNFLDLDWLMDEAGRQQTSVTLAVGQKTPRWPECHLPAWWRADGTDGKAQLLAYISAVVSRYKNHPALDSWQVENEPFIHFAFGDCPNFRRDWVKDEIRLVRSLDRAHPVVVTDSGELGLWYGASRAGDILGTTAYRLVVAPNNFFINYSWLPASVYRLRARLLGKTHDKFFVSELQAEPWFINGQTPQTTPIDQQEKTMNPARLRSHIEFARHSGASRAYLWGAEWWYFIKDKRHDPRYWGIAKQAFRE